MKLISPENYKLLTKEYKAKICNGSGSAGTPKWIVKMLDNIGGIGIDYKECSNIHDYQYFIGKKYIYKIYADIIYLINLIIVNILDCFTLPLDNIIGALILLPIRIIRALIYFSAVFLLGRKAYYKGKVS